MGLENSTATLKNSLVLSNKVKHASILYLATLPWYLAKREENLFPQRDLNKTNDSGFIHNDPKFRVAHMSINRGT